MPCLTWTLVCSTTIGTNLATTCGCKSVILSSHTLHLNIWCTAAAYLLSEKKLEAPRDHIFGSQNMPFPPKKESLLTIILWSSNTGQKLMGKLWGHEVAPVSALAKAPSQCELFHPPVRDNCCDIVLSHLAMRQWQKLEKFQSCNAQGTQNLSHYMAIG